MLAVLSNLKQEQYGYSLLKNLAGKGLEVDQGTLYPLLRRLESQGLLQSQWRVDSDHPRRYYVASPAGRKYLERMKEDWTGIIRVMENILEDNPGGKS